MLNTDEVGAVSFHGPDPALFALVRFKNKLFVQPISSLPTDQFLSPTFYNVLRIIKFGARERP